MSNNFLRLTALSKSFGDQLIIDSLDMSIRQGAMVTLLGPSGCGKTTVLRLIAGLERADRGEIWLDGQNVTHAPITARDIGMVFQSYALFPHLSIGENVGYGLKMLGVAKAERIARVREALALVDLVGFEDRFVDQISGGQQQRVALARALILRPKVLLFDEPLSNLDANLRRTMREKIRELQQNLGITALYVTHDQSEAFAVSDEVIVMNEGRIIQQAPASELYHHPNSPFIAHFMGESSLFRGTLSKGMVTINGYCFPLQNAASFNLPDGQCLVGIRPEAVNFTEQGLPAQRCHITRATYMGNYWEILADWFGQPLLIHAQAERFSHQREIYISFSSNRLFLLSPETAHETIAKRP